ncbi:MAG: hypothetical protein KC502_15560, partial [Myxococcales bacterium]|nr:hypothetical protein [Myxococcales bacterium]
MKDAPHTDLTFTNKRKDGFLGCRPRQHPPQVMPRPVAATKRIAPWVLVLLMCLASCSGSSPPNGQQDTLPPDGTGAFDVLESHAPEAGDAGEAETEDTSQWRSVLFPSDWQPGHTTPGGRALDDYSYAGYRNGLAPLPTPNGANIFVVSLPASLTDSVDRRAAIQTAIDAVGAHKAAPGKPQPHPGGVVQLGKGVYRVNGTLFIKHSNVVLRGHGADETRLWFTDANVVEAQAHLKVGGPLSHGKDLLLTADGARGDTVVRVGDASALNPGDDVDVGWQISPAFVAAHGMTGTWKAFNGSWRPFFRRTVVSVD